MLLPLFTSRSVRLLLPLFMILPLFVSRSVHLNPSVLLFFNLDVFVRRLW